MVFGVILLFSLLLNLSLGSVGIPLEDILKSLTTGQSSKDTWHHIITDYRLPKAITAVISGSGLAIAGLLMQTLFKNPLAGPYVLGISSGASLGVALYILGGALMGWTVANQAGRWGLILSASTGSLAVLLMVLAAARRVRDTMTLLIIGLMVGSLTAAVVSILAYFSKAQELQQYIFWSYGSLGDLSWPEIYILLFSFIIGLLLAISSLKALNALLLGDTYAKTIGLAYLKSRLLIILATSILAGSITAFAGPIAFIGLAVPHLIRQVFRTANHTILLPAVAIGGAILMLLCDIVAQVPLSEYKLPINAITALVGAPVVIWLLIRKRRLMF